MCIRDRSTAVRLAPFNLPQIQALTDHDDMNLYTLGEKKVALYAVTVSYTHLIQNIAWKW